MNHPGTRIGSGSTDLPGSRAVRSGAARRGCPARVLLCNGSTVTPREGTRPTRRGRPGPPTRRHRLMRLCSVVTVMIAGLVGASAQPDSRSASVVAGGGGTSANSQYSLSGTIGQPATAAQSDGHFTIQAGFWAWTAGREVVIPDEHLLVWTNTRSGKWSVATNWKPNRVPGPADTAVLDLRSTYTVTVDASQTVAALTLGPGATLAGANLLTVLGPFTWTGGTLNSRVQCNGGSVSGTSSHALSGGRLANTGMLALTAPITTAGAAIITNLPGAVLDLAGDVGLTYSSGGYGAVINQGTLRKSAGTGVSQISEVITNTGTIETRSGTLDLSRGCVQTGGATVVGEGQLHLGQGMLLAGGLLTGTNLIAGAITNSGGILAPGSSSGGLEIQGRYVQTAGGRLVIEVGGPNPGTDFDVLTVNGVAKLGGTLAVSFVNGFVPATDSTFEFLAGGSCLGAFDAFDPALESLGLTILYAPDHVALRTGGPPQPQVLPPYAISDLGGLGGVGASPQAINNEGQVVGFSPVAGGGSHAFLYDRGRMLDLGTLAGPNSRAYGINDAGHVVGWSTTTAGTAPVHAFYYDGTMHDLGTLPGPANASSTAYGINNHDDVIGYSDTQGPGFSTVHPFLYRDGALTDLQVPLYPGRFNAGAWAYGLNDGLQVVGKSARAVGSPQGYRYDFTTGVAWDVGGLGGANGSVAQAVNRAGLVTGWAYIDNNLWVHAYRYDGRIHDLGTLGGRNSHGLAVNNHGQIVGRAEEANGTPHAFLYADGQMSDLNSVLPPNSEWTLREATGINDRGQIVGIATRKGATGWRAFLLTPESAAPPSLKLQLAPGDTLAIVWSIKNPNCRVQENPVLSPTGWAEVEVAPTVVGDEMRVVLPRPAGTRFYRLLQP